MSVDLNAEAAGRLRRGHRLVFLGAGAQLAGAGLDALLHRFDPSLAAREGPLSLTNPGHLLLGVGMGLVLVGISYASLAGPLAGGSRLPVFILAALSIAVGVTAAATGASGGHGAPHGRNSLTHATSRWDDLVLAELRGALSAGGLPAALDRLDDLARRDTLLYRRSHAVVHDLGRLAYRHYRDVATAFRRCDPRFDGGCYHGVLRAHLRRASGLPVGGLSPFCESLARAAPRELLMFECVHGLGHALYAVTDSDMVKTLRLCDGFGTRVDRSHCYGGVFMEAVNTGLGLGHTIDIPARSDPARRSLLPCGALAVRYRWACYGTQPLAMLTGTSKEFGPVVDACERSPAPYAAACLEGVGSYLEGYTVLSTRHGLPQARELCMLASVPGRSSCFIGVVGASIAADWTVDASIRFCRSVPPRSAPACFDAVGWRLPGLHRPSDAKAECRKAGHHSWIATCVRATRLRLRANADGHVDPGVTVVAAKPAAG